MTKNISNKIANQINWKKVVGLVPAVIQDASNGLVLMLGYMNKEALEKTVSTSFVWFYSRTKKRLWMKGEESGNTLKVKDILLDCDGDTLLVKAIPNGPTCHTGKGTCFGETADIGSLQKLFATITSRKKNLPADSYTTSLFKAGLDKIALKVAEESLEVVHAAQKETPQRLAEESADLIYHLFVLLAEKGLDLNDIEKEIVRRRRTLPRREKRHKK